MQLGKKDLLFSILIILSASFFSLSYNFETRGLIEGTIQSGTINYPEQFNLFRVVSINSWTLPIQIITILLKINFAPLIISKIILFISTLMFFTGIYLTTKSLTSSYLFAFLVSFLILLLKKNFGHLDYPTMIFTEHTNGLMAQALSTLVFGFLINNNLRLGFFFSILLLATHLTVGLWVNFIIFITLILRFKKYKNIVLNKKNFFFTFVSLIIVLGSFFYHFEQRIPLNFIYDDETYRTYMNIWEDHRSAWGLYSNWINYEYITKTFILILLIFLLLRVKLNKNYSDFGISVLLLSCILSFFLYITYKYFYFLFPDIIVRTMPTRFFLLHSVIGWPVIFSIVYLFVKIIVLKLNINIKYSYFFFLLILIINLLQHNFNFIERYQGIKTNLLISNKNNIENQFWNKIKTIDLNGFYLTGGPSNVCQKTVAVARKPMFTCAEALNNIPYYPHIAVPAKKIVEEVFNIPFNNPKVKHMGGISESDLKSSYENKSYKNWIDLKNKFNITALIVPKKWKINLKVFISSDIYSFYVIR